MDEDKNFLNTNHEYLGQATIELKDPFKNQD